MDFIFHRDKERQALKQRLLNRKPFLLHGPAGVGKTLLVRSLLPQLPAALYCETSSTAQAVFRSLAQALLERGDPRLQASCRNRDGIQPRSAVALKGIVMDALREWTYSVVLDRLDRPSQAFAAVVREIIGWCSTPVIAVARSSHMEDAGFLRPLYSDRSERYELRNFDSPDAERFAAAMVQRARLSALNLSEFLARVVEFSEGNPGAILTMLQIPWQEKYRSGEHIKITPLYIDFRTNWRPAARR